MELVDNISDALDFVMFRWCINIKKHSKILMDFD